MRPSTGDYWVEVVALADRVTAAACTPPWFCRPAHLGGVHVEVVALIVDDAGVQHVGGEADGEPACMGWRQQSRFQR